MTHDGFNLVFRLMPIESRIFIELPMDTSKKTEHENHVSHYKIIFILFIFNLNGYIILYIYL
jgi:hypothetical protein